MPIARVQSTSQSMGAGPYGLAFSGSVTSGNLLVWVARLGVTADPVTSVADSVNSGNWSLAKFQGGTGSNVSVAIYYKIANATGTPTVTPVLSGSPTCRHSIHEYSGIDATPLDQTAGANGTSTGPNSGNITTTQADELLVGVVGSALDLGSSTFTNTSTLTQQHQLTGAAFTSLDKIVAATSTYSVGGTFNLSDRWAAALVSFKGAAASDAPPGFNRSRGIPGARAGGNTFGQGW